MSKDEHRMTKRQHDERFDTWESKVDGEILRYLKQHAGDEYDPDGSIAASVSHL